MVIPSMVSSQGVFCRILCLLMLLKYYSSTLLNNMYIVTHARAQARYIHTQACNTHTHTQTRAHTKAKSKAKLTAAVT